MCRCYRGQVESSLAFLVLHGGICSMSEQQSAELCAPLLGGLMEGCERPFVCSIHACIVLYQQGSDIDMLSEGEEDKEQMRLKVRSDLDKVKAETNTLEGMCESNCKGGGCLAHSSTLYTILV